MMAALTKTVTTDAGENVVLTRTTDDPGEANALRMQGWTPAGPGQAPAPAPSAGAPAPKPNK
ncbi:hypothetical protein QU668_03865 [Schaalia sp. HMT-877]|nr:hypothetical protein HMPREF1550_00194 [Actinomyces sp. oral taxon 877 str. F0543]WLD80883.1 hypothetical protein QU668_03865 [Schaalia sp. HMT-877]